MAGGLLVLAPARAAWSLGVTLFGVGTVAVFVTASPAAQFDDSGVGAFWHLLADVSEDQLLMAPGPVTAIMVLPDGCSAVVELVS